MTNDPKKNQSLPNNSYVRPNQHWTCGHAKEGCPCPLGPSKNGTCRAAFECKPHQKQDSWICTRALSQGDRCDEGPMPDGTCCRPITPCVPVRSLTSRRTQVSMGIFAFAIGLALILLSFPSQAGFVSPGPLTKHHATTANGCADCHDADSGLKEWIGTAMHPSAAIKQSQQCLECHPEIGTNALASHSISDDSIQDITADTHSRHATSGSDFMTSLAKLTFGSPDESGKLRCASCHLEHGGALQDLKQLTNQQCQVCHVNSFHSFANGHPEFDSYPYRRRKRIYFDHATHYGSHFVKTAQSNMRDHSCSQCHVLDEAGASMQVVGFEQGCASCHETQIKEDLIPGALMAAVPGLDIESLRAGGFEIGLWPATYPLHASAKGRIPALMKLMLSSNPRFVEIVSELDKLDVSKLRQATKDELRVVEEFAWILKEHLYESITHSPEHEQGELGLDPAARELLDQVPSEMLAGLQRRWFPNLVVEVSARRNNSPFEFVEPIETRELSQIVDEQNRHSNSITNGWYLQDADMTLRYRPIGHADPLMKSILNYVTRQSNQPTGKNNSLVDNPTQHSINELFASTTSPFTIGRCTKCHTIDKTPVETVANWLGKTSQRSRKPFTKFRHLPHLGNSTDAECNACHQPQKPAVQPAVIFRPEFVHPSGALATDPSNFTCDFSTINKSNCSSCHQPQSAGDSCLDCHNYHVR